MAVHYETKGIILKETDWGEAHRIFTVFTKEFGKLNLWAVSERKITSKLRGGLGLFALSHLEFVEGKNRKVLVEAFCLHDPTPIRSDLRKLKATLAIASLLDRVVAGEERDQGIWDILEGSLRQLREGHFPRAVQEAFTSRFLKTTGYANFENYANQ